MAAAIMFLPRKAGEADREAVEGAAAWRSFPRPAPGFAGPPPALRAETDKRIAAR